PGCRARNDSPSALGLRPWSVPGPWSVLRPSFWVRPGSSGVRVLRTRTKDQERTKDRGLRTDQGLRPRARGLFFFGFFGLARGALAHRLVGGRFVGRLQHDEPG